MRCSIVVVKLLCLACLSRAALPGLGAERAATAPNIILILTDDQRHDALGCAGNDLARTPHLDSLAARGVRFSHAFVTLSICSPSRAACLTGRYGSANGVTTLGQPLREGEQTFVQRLAGQGYATGVAGKWHLGSTPAECGFQFASFFRSNGPYYNRSIVVDGQSSQVPGFIDDWVADQALRFVDSARSNDKPFVLWLCTQVPHMNHRFDWNAREETLALFDEAEMPLPTTWQDDLSGKPEYLKTSRSRLQALEYGYDQPASIRRHWQRYLAAVHEVDASIGKLINGVTQRGLDSNTWYLFMGDNGWFMGEHGFTSKVLPYEESIRVPMIVAGPDTEPRVDDHLVLNIDLAATVLDIAGLPVPADMHGHSLLPLVRGERAAWRESFLYEAPTSALGSWPLFAVRTDRWKYIRTHDIEKRSEIAFEELYDLQHDPRETRNLASDASAAETRRRLSEQLDRLKAKLE